MIIMMGVLRKELIPAPNQRIRRQNKREPHAAKTVPDSLSMI